MNTPIRISMTAALAVCMLFQTDLCGQETEASSQTPRIFNVRDFGAAGDGETLDTAAINRAIGRCSEAGGGQVLFPPGNYLTGTIHLQSNVTVVIGAAAKVIGSQNLDDYQWPKVPPEMIEAGWGKWHRAIFVGQGLENVSILGPGTIDGAKVYDPQGEERMRGPHAIVFTGCRNMAFRDFNVVDAANYGVFFTASDDCEFRNLKFVGGWDGIHWRGSPNRWCRGVDIVDCQFYTGDDAIAGRYWQDTLITGCVVNSSCNGIRLIGPAKNLTIHDNLFFGPGRQPHRSSRDGRRTNMLSGIILQPSGWDATEGDLDGVLLSDNTMRNVASPVTLINKPNNRVGRVTIDGLRATEVYRAAMSFEGWGTGAPIHEVIVRDATIEYTGGGTSEQGAQEVQEPGVDARPLPTWGLYARNVESIKLQDVRVDVAQEDARPVVLIENVDRMVLDDFDHPPADGGTEAVQTRGKSEVIDLERTPAAR